MVYAQTDLYKIDARYGTNEEYVNFLRNSKKRDMKLVEDYVTNHWGVSVLVDSGFCLLKIGSTGLKMEEWSQTF